MFDFPRAIEEILSLIELHGKEKDTLRIKVSRRLETWTALSDE